MLIALIPVESVTWACHSPIPLVWPQCGGDRQMPGELGKETRVQRRIVRHLGEAHPRVEHRRTDRGLWIARVCSVDDPQVAPGHAHVERRRVAW